MQSSSARLLVGFSALVAFVAGCPPRRPLPDPVVTLPMVDAVAIVNENIARIPGTIRATGTVDGSFRDSDGRTRRYSVDATLFYLAPSYLRFDLKSFGERQFLFGSNAEQYWFHNGRDGSFLCGRQGVENDFPPELPVQPYQIIEALGLTAVPTEHQTSDMFRVQRIEGDYQQVLFVGRNPFGTEHAPVVLKEYWLNGRQPRLVHRVLFRDPNGLVDMDAKLGDYQRVSPQGPWLPGSLDVDWPALGTSMEFRVAKWTVVEQVGPTSAQFETPEECLKP